jgi:hypothetical protein
VSDARYPDTADHYGDWMLSNHFTWLDTCAHCAMKKRQLAHDAICYGYPKCMSCGCVAGTPCIYHRGSPRYANELAERQAIALEKAAGVK